MPNHNSTTINKPDSIDLKMNRSVNRSEFLRLLGKTFMGSILFWILPYPLYKSRVINGITWRGVVRDAVRSPFRRPLHRPFHRSDLYAKHNLAG